MRFDPEYVSQVLNENFEDAKTLFLSPLVAIHYAHLVMLAERGIVSAADARTIRDALDALSLPDIRTVAYDAAWEDLFFYVERLIIDRCGEDVAGRLHTARSRNDIAMTTYRMRQREDVLTLIGAVHELRRALLALAARHRNSIYGAHTHTQPAQPTTVAHYLLAVCEQLARDSVRLQAGFASTNQNPLGACAITGTGFDIDRALTSELLGFSGPTINTYGSIATVDYMLESTSATGVMLAGLGRVVQDLLLWCTMEFGYLRLADGFVQSSSIMPQKRNPVALEHSRAIGSRALGQVSAILLAVHNTPFGDIVDTEDDFQPLVASMFRDAIRTVRLVGAAMRTADFNVERLEARASEGGTTMTELADHLVREHGMAFKTAHAIAAGLMKGVREAPATPLVTLLRDVSTTVLGTPLSYTEEQLAKVLDPRHFVEIRKTLGGPAPSETARALAVEESRLASDDEWVRQTRTSLTDAERRLRERSRQL